MISIVYGLIPLLQTIIYPFSDIIVDKFDIRKVVSIILLFQSIALTCFILIPDPLYSSLALVTASGLGAIYNIAYRTLIVKSCPEESKATSIALINDTWNIVQIIAPSVGALLWTINSYLPFYLSVIPLLLTSITISLA